MPIDLTKIPARLIEAVKQRNLVPFIGAGVSKQAANAFPTWGELLSQMLAHALTNNLLKPAEGKELKKLMDRGQYLMVAEALRYTLATDEYETFLTDRFSPAGVGPAAIHKLLFKLKPPVILTTNYDQLLEDAYAEEYKKVPAVMTYRDAALAQRTLQSNRLPERPIVFKIHGSIDSVETLILSERDYRELIYRQPGYRALMSAIFLTHAVLMIGFSFSDRELILLLETLREALKHRASPDYILLPEKAAGPVETRRFREDFGLQVISYKPTTGHPEVGEFIQHLVAQMP